MLRTKVISRPVVIIEKKICNSCEKEVNHYDHEFDEWFTISHDCGYLSTFGDGNTIHIDLCQQCTQTRIGDLIKKL